MDRAEASAGQNRRTGPDTLAAPRGLPAGRWFGIKVGIDLSLLLIFSLVVINLGAGVLPAWHADWSGALRWTIAVLAAVLFFLSILIHELSHAVVARAFGIRVRGITLFMFGGVAQIEDEPARPRDEFLVAAAGPLTSLLIGFAATLAGSWLGADAFARHEDLALVLRELGPVATTLLWLGPINVALAIFNMVPGFPLDGGRVLRALLWWLSGSLLDATRWASLAGQAFGWLLIATGVLMMFGIQVPFLGVGLVPGLWLALIGWFLSSSARLSYERMLVQRALAGNSVAELMTPRVVTVAPDTTLQELVHDKIMGTDQRCFVVTDLDSVRGMVCLADVRRVNPASWGSVTVAEVMTPHARLRTLRPEQNASEALRELSDHEIDQIPVLDGDRLLGIVRRRDVLKWIDLHTAERRAERRPQLPGAPRRYGV